LTEENKVLFKHIYLDLDYKSCPSGVMANFAYVDNTVYCLADDECAGYEVCDITSPTRLTDRSLSECRNLLKK